MIAISGRLGADPKPQQTKTDTKMATGFMFGNVDTRGDDDISLPLNIVAFGHQAENLLRHSKGQFLTVSGKLQGSIYNSETRYTVVADSILSAKSVQPKGGAKKPAYNPHVVYENKGRNGE